MIELKMCLLLRRTVLYVSWSNIFSLDLKISICLFNKTREWQQDEDTVTMIQNPQSRVDVVGVSVTTHGNIVLGNPCKCQC